MLKFASVILVINNDDEILLLRRGKTDPWRPGYWNLPGGKSELGEKPADTAIRELHEEVGIKVKKENIELLFSYLAHGKRPIYVFATQLDECNPSLTFDHEHDKGFWFKSSEIPTKVVPGIARVVSFLNAQLKHRRIKQSL